MTQNNNSDERAAYTHGFALDSEHYTTIAKALYYLNAHALNAPSLEQLASEVGMSTYHFQRVFTEYVGVSPKKFSQLLTLNFTKNILQEPVTMQEAAFMSGLSGTGRLHDLFIAIEAMTPGEYQAGGRGLSIRYSQQITPFGEIGVASTPKGICDLSFATRDSFYSTLRLKYPQAQFADEACAIHRQAAAVIAGVHSQPLHLHLRGTPFQLKVWQWLLQIPSGQLASYGGLASWMSQPSAARAVGTAIGANPVAYLVPCHRVIQATGALGGYRWDVERKRLLLAWEAAGLYSRE